MNTILIVDDTPANLQLLFQILSERGYTILSAKSGEKALEIVQDHRPDLILLDINMIGMDGYQTAQHLKANPKTQSIPIIFISAAKEPEDKVKAFISGGVDYVTKPIQPIEVMARVETHMVNANHKQQLEIAVVERTAELETSNEQLAQANEQLAQALAQLEAANRLLAALNENKTEFIDVAAHELRTPLTIISGYTQILQTMVADTEAQDVVKGIIGGAERMHDVVNSMLDVSRLQTLKVCAGCVDVHSIFQSLASAFDAALRDRQLTLNVALDDMPTIQADPDLMQKTFYHLLINAIKYTPDGGAITVNGRNGQGEIEVIVADTGIGIDPAHHELIFEKFYQTGKVALHSSGKTKFKGGGPGLGLAVVKGIVEAHGGKVWVESEGHDEEGCPGSAFHVVLPVGVEDAETT